MISLIKRKNAYIFRIHFTLQPQNLVGLYNERYNEKYPQNKVVISGTVLVTYHLISHRNMPYLINTRFCESANNHISRTVLRRVGVEKWEFLFKISKEYVSKAVQAIPTLVLHMLCFNIRKQ